MYLGNYVVGRYLPITYMDRLIVLPLGRVLVHGHVELRQHELIIIVPSKTDSIYIGTPSDVHRTI